MIDNIFKYTEYLVRGRDKNGEFEVRRRFKDFVKVQEMVVARWPGCLVP